MKYRILEEVFEDGHSKFYAQYFGKIMTANRCSTVSAVSFDAKLDWIPIDFNCFLGVDTIEEAMTTIKFHKQQQSPKVKEIIHEIE